MKETPLSLSNRTRAYHIIGIFATEPLEGAKPLGQPQQNLSKLRHLAGIGDRRHLGQGSQAALMQAGESLQMLIAYPFFPAIDRMAVQRKLRLRQPAVQCFGIDAQATTSVSYRDEGHWVPPFLGNRQHEREPA